MYVIVLVREEDCIKECGCMLRSQSEKSEAYDNAPYP